MSCPFGVPDFAVSTDFPFGIATLYPTAEREWKKLVDNKLTKYVN